MIGFPFDNQSATVQDRNIDSDIYAEYLKRLVGTNGIFADVGTKCQVTAGEGMTVIVKPGDGFIEGRLFIEDKSRTLLIQSSENLDRIDTVVVRLDLEARAIDYDVKKGTAATYPTAPTLTREGGVYELGLANVLVPKTSTAVASSRITDTRLNTARCGVAPVLGSIDTQGLYDQYQSSLDDFLEIVQEAIDGTLAGNLQSQIDTNAAKISTIGNPITNGEIDGLFT